MLASARFDCAGDLRKMWRFLYFLVIFGPLIKGNLTTMMRKPEAKAPATVEEQ